MSILGTNNLGDVQFFATQATSLDEVIYFISTGPNISRLLHASNTLLSYNFSGKLVTTNNCTGFIPINTITYSKMQKVT